MRFRFSRVPATATLLAIITAVFILEWYRGALENNDMLYEMGAITPTMLQDGQWWRIFGVLLLTGLVIGVVGQVVAVPLAVVGALGPTVFPGTAGALLLVLSSFLSQILVGAITTPFTSAVTALQYVDQRIRKEGLDVELIAASKANAPGPR